MNNKTALITGATSGIGFAFARIFAKEHYNLVIVARNLEKLQEVKNNLEKEFQVSVVTIQKDLAKASSSQEVYDEIKRQNITVTTIINNAGFGHFGSFVMQDLQIAIDMVNLNITSLTALMRLFLPDMVASKEGQILNVASTAAFQPGPSFAVYYATKAYVLSLSEALRSELKPYGIAVTCLCPGPTKTEFFTNNPVITESKLIKYANFMTAEQVANIGFKGLRKNKAVVIPGFMNKIVAYIAQVSPRSIVTMVSKWTLEK